VESNGATLIISAPTFVRTWLRRIERHQLKSLRLVVVGAERCPDELRTAFQERFGIALLEGYGCTELAPTVAVNLPTVVRDGITEQRSRDGSVGRALPGLHVFAVDIATHAVLPPGGEGLLVVRSPARMRGYLGRPDLTAEVFIHGGYNTGDVGHVDVDGFIHITGRLARFAKIGGEMVPLDHVQAALMQVAGDRDVVVSAVPDAVRGERVVVMHTGVAGGTDALLKALEGQPVLWRPKPKDVREVASIPKLGTGKLDLGLIKQQARELFGG
jgi:acyl-[acyl-carrier-protein]-phospholipid O-acyltransferase/long-chain-fatty-acid--[acyl-carrier-protein] ligase